MKRNNFTSRRKIGLATVVMLFACAVAFSQQGQKLAQAQQENAEKLRHYTWKSRTEIRKDGETKKIQSYRMEYNSDGTLQQTQIGETFQQKIPTQGLRGLIAKKKKEDFVEMLDGLGALAKSYGKLPPDKMQSFMMDAAVTPEISLKENLVCIKGRAILQPGDSMTICLDASTQKQRQVEIQTTFDKKPVRIVSELQDLPNGPTYTARSVIEYPSQKLTVTTENSDYIRKQ